MSDTQAAFRESWERWGKLMDHVLAKPGVQAIPEVFDALNLLGEAIASLAHDVDRTRWPEVAPTAAGATPTGTAAGTGEQ